MSDNRKTYRLDDTAQAILNDLKESRSGTENEAVNLIIKQFPLKEKRIAELQSELVTARKQICQLHEQIKLKDQEKAEVKNAFALIGKLFDSSRGADQPGALLGQANT